MPSRIGFGGIVSPQVAPSMAPRWCDAAGHDAAGCDTVGYNAAWHDTVGCNAAGRKAAGRDAA